MVRRQSGAVFRQIHRLFGSGTVAGLAEGQLLERFVARRDEVAFEAIVARHGPMVLGVCRRVLADPHDVEDAFQATFLILVRKAGSLRDRDLLGNWLYGVAHRVAVRARANAARRRRFEASVDGAEALVSPAEAEGNDLRRVLDEELGRLPESYRAPIVLCHLEGRTHDQAAEQLGCPVGTVRSRLSRGRERLRKGLTRRGLALSTGLLGAALDQGAASAAPAALVQSTTTLATRFAAKGAAAGAVPASVAALMQGVLKAMIVNKLLMATAVVLAVGAIAGGVGVLAQQEPEAAPPAKAGVAAPPAKPAARPARDGIATQEPETPKKVANPAMRGVGAIPGMPGEMPGGMPTSQIKMVQTDSIIAVPSPGRDRVMAYSMETGTWKSYRLPNGAKEIIPILSRNTMGLRVVPNTEVTQVAAFDAKTGEWYPHVLRKPWKYRVFPLVSDGVVVYHLGRHVYAFSTTADRWADLELKESPRALVILRQQAVTVEQGSDLHVFSLKLGKWDSIDTKAE